MKKLKIGWQKYEDLLEQQLSSPLLRMLIETAIQDENLKEEERPVKYEPEEVEEQAFPILNITDDIANHIAISSNFDCWVGHTNFDITPTILKSMDELEGVEILKIFSRYRFFIGVGRMFNFKNVRSELETKLKSEN